MEELIKYKQDNKIGYKDDEGNVVIMPQFDEGPSFWNSNQIYATVVKGGLCGVINRNGEIIIPFEYDCILYNGETSGVNNPKDKTVKQYEYDYFLHEVHEVSNVFLIQKDGLWGAKDLNGIDVPVGFEEIKILNGEQGLFSVKITGSHKEKPFYTIVDKHGELFKKMRYFSGQIKEHFLHFYNVNRILAKHNNKYGFISANGYVSIPFKYDKLYEREDKLFDICIGKAWGVMNLEGKEIISAKYKEIPLKWSNKIVEEVSSKKLTVLSDDGTELVPSIYDFLYVTDKFIFFGYKPMFESTRGVRVSTYNHQDETIIIYDVKCRFSLGCLDRNNKILIEALYDRFIIYGDFLLAGRDGLGDNDSTEYNGVFDLYDYNGNLLLGGFNRFEEIGAVLLFHFGGSDKELSYEEKQYNGMWFLTNRNFKNLKSIIKKKDGSSFQIKKGSICTINAYYRDEKDIIKSNFPIELFSFNKPIIQNKFAIIGNGKKRRVISLSDGKTSPLHDGFRFYDDSMFFSYDNDKQNKKDIRILRERNLHKNYFEKANKKDFVYIGLSTIDEELIKTSDGFLALTFPVHGYVFALKANDKEDIAQLVFINTKAPECLPIVAIKRNAIDELIDYFWNGNLKLFYDEKNKLLLVKNVEIFDKEFVQIMKLASKKSTFEDDSPYWYSEFSNLYYDDKKNDDDDGFYDYRDDEYNHIDTLSDSWDAMTDGMYGDMPEGFDGDYDFLGR